MTTDWYPAATQRQIGKFVRPRTVTPNAIVLHVAVSEATSLFSFFSGAKVCSHLYVARDGAMEQYLPISSKSSADYIGNNRTISIESQGDGNGPWTPEQVAALAGFLRWAHDEHGIELRLMASSQPSEHGLGWHRLGIDGSFPALPSPYAGRGQRGGGEVWSTSTGKTCPGNAKINQVPEILSLAANVTLGSRTLKIRDQGEDVKDLQRRLNALPTALPVLDPDGDYYTKTAARVAEFEGQWGLAATGVFDAEAYAMLLKAEAPPTPAPDPVPDPVPVPSPVPTPTPDPVPVPDPIPVPEPIPAPKPSTLAAILTAVWNFILRIFNPKGTS